MENLNRFIKVAKGEEKAELVLKNAQVFHVFTGEFIKNDVAIENGYIAGIGQYEGKKELDLTGKYLTPGFVDSHIHIESSMLSPLEFARVVVPLGTTTVVADPHEIANVTGLAGIRYLLAETEKLPINAYFMLPSCVPATNMENSGATLLAEDLAELIEHPRVLGLGEMMNYPGVLFGDETVLDKLKLAKGKKIDGHAPNLVGNELMAYSAAGIESDHECVTPEQALEKLRAGLYIMIREGSAAKNLKPLLPIINAYTAPFCCFAADDRHPADLITEGHINYMVKTAVQEGIPLPMALQMATINAARYFGLKDIGAIAPRYKADILVFDNLNDWQPELVFKDGSIVAKNKKAEFVRDAIVPNKIKQTMHIAPIIKEKLQIKATGSRANVIGLVPHQIVTKHLKIDVQVTDGCVCLPKDQDLLKLAVFERHSATGNIGVGLVEGFGLEEGAIASTIAHDSHNLIAIGKNDEDIIKAAEVLKKIQGGVVIVKHGEVVGELSLPIAGLMSEQSAAAVEEKLAQLKEIAYKMGVFKDYDPFLTLAFLSLPVIPELKLTDLGLVDVSSFSFIPLMEDDKI
jgi:adenine deaminase